MQVLLLFVFILFQENEAEEMTTGAACQQRPVYKMSTYAYLPAVGGSVRILRYRKRTETLDRQFAYSAVVEHVCPAEKSPREQTPPGGRPLKKDAIGRGDVNLYIFLQALVPHIRAKRQWGGCCGMMMSMCCSAPIMMPPPMPPPMMMPMQSCCGCCLPVCMPIGCGCGGGGFGGGFSFGMFGRKKREALIRSNTAPALRITWQK